MNELISVVVPVYNASKYLKKCINSISNQTYKELEIIVVNDGSTDNSQEILNKLYHTDKRIKVINQKNSGSMIARKNGVLNCSSESKYLCFCDSDDVMPRDAIMKLYTACKTNESDISIGNLDKLFKNITLKSRYVPPCFKECDEQKSNITYHKSEFIEKLYCSWFGISNVPVSLWGKLFKTSLIKNIMINTPKIVDFFGDDLVITLNCMPLANQITIINEVVYHYRIGGGTSKLQPKMMEDWIALYNYKKEFSERYPMPQNIEYLMDVELCNMAFSYFLMCKESRKFKKQELTKIISEACDLPEVKKASNNQELAKNAKATLLKNNDVDGIMSMVMHNYYRALPRKVLKQLIKLFV